ncbi:hypothetical protein WA158_007865 [Blastocystis sp. Blastoise]
MGGQLPFNIVYGQPGYINLCDALNSWMLVKEVEQSCGIVAAASFKHVSPAGAAIGTPLTDLEKQAYEVNGDFSPATIAYIRARNADPMSSFGDFAACSGTVDVSLAKFLANTICDGIIAKGYEPEALEILKGKKGGKFIVLEGNINYKVPEMEFRELHGAILSQKHNDALITKKDLENIVTKNKNIPEEAINDLILGCICLKYTQSNSVGYSLNGQMIGVGAGQQSRIDCVKLAARKVACWYLRFHPKVLGLKFKPTVKRQQRVNARVRYIEGDFTEIEKNQWLENFEEIPPEFTQEDRTSFLTTLKNVSLTSDAFFPFRDNIDCASKYGVKYIAQPGGSVQDDGVIVACDEYDMAMAFTGIRLFHH